MIIDIDGEENEMTRVNGIHIPQDKFDVMDIPEGYVLAELPCGFNPEKHDPLIEEVFASKWKKSWDPNNLTLTPENGTWEVGLAVSSVISAYVRYFSDTFWKNSAGHGAMYYVGNDSDGTAESLANVRIFVKMPTENAIKMFSTGEMDSSLFKKRYNELIAKNGEYMDYTGPVDASLSINIANEIDPAVWTIALMCSKAIPAKLGKDATPEDIFTDFINHCSEELESSIYILSPSDKEESDKMRAALQEA